MFPRALIYLPRSSNSFKNKTCLGSRAVVIFSAVPTEDTVPCGENQESRLPCRNLNAWRYIYTVHPSAGLIGLGLFVQTGPPLYFVGDPCVQTMHVDIDIVGEPSVHTTQLILRLTN